MVNEGIDDPQKALANGIDPTNYALDADKSKRFEEDIAYLFKQIEAQRVPLEQKWNEYHHVWARKNTTESRFYTGVNDAYFPVAFSNVETLVAYVASQLFQAGPKFAIKAPNMMTPPQLIQKFSALFDYFLHVCNLESNFNDFTRQGMNYGPSIVKNVWRDERESIFKPQVVQSQNEDGSPAFHPATMNDGITPHPMANQPVTEIQPVEEEISTYLGPTFRVVDMLSIYLYPFQARELDECEIIYEKIDKDFRDLKAAETAGYYLGVDRLKTGESINSSRDTSSQRDANQDVRNAPHGLSANQIKDKNKVTINEVWCKFDLYGTGKKIACKAVYSNSVLIELRQNPYWKQKPPYRLFRGIKHMDHIYGMGWMEIGAHHQYTMNAVINQALDANLFQTNQMMAINADRYQGRLADIQMVPLGVLPFSGEEPVQDAFEFHKPENTAAEAFAVANIVAGNLQDSFGTPPVTQGKFTNKERTATEVNAVASGASTRIDFMVRQLALIMQWWMEDSFAHLQQFCPDDLDFKVTGSPAIHFNREDTLLMPFMQWLTKPESDAWQQQQMQQQAMDQQMAENQLQSAPKGGQPGPGNQDGMGGEGGIGNSSGM